MTGCFQTKQDLSAKDLRQLSMEELAEGRKLAEQGRYEQAIPRFEKSLQFRPSPAAHFELGETLAQLGRYKQARSQYQLALARNSEYEDAERAIQRMDALMRIDVDDLAPPQSRTSMPTLEAPGEVAQSSHERGVLGLSSAARSGSNRSTERQLVQTREPPLQPDEITTSGRLEPEISESERLLGDTRAIYGTSEAPRTLPPAPPGSRPAGDRGLLKTNAGRGSEPVGDFSSSRNLPPPVIASSPSDVGDWSDVEQDSPRPGLERRSILEERQPRQVVVAPQRDLGPPAGRPAVAESHSAGRGLLSGSSGIRPPVVSDAPVFVEQQTDPREKSVLSQTDSRQGPSESSNRRDTVSEKSTVVREVMGSSRITYPEPPPVEEPDPLPRAYANKESLDLRAPFTIDRFQGRSLPQMDLQVCRDYYYVENDLERAISCFATKKIDFPESPQVYSELAKIYADAGLYGKARQEYEMALRYDPSNIEFKEAIQGVTVQEARVLGRQGDIQSSVRMLMAVIERFPSYVPAHRELGKAYSRDAIDKENAIAQGSLMPTEKTHEVILQNWESAESAFTTVVNLDPTNYQDWYNLAVSIQKQAKEVKTQTAIRCYQRCLDLNPDYADAHHNLAVLYENINPNLALEHYGKALALARQIPGEEGEDLVARCLASLGELTWRMGQTDQAAHYLTEYSRLVPDDDRVLKILGQIASEPVTQ